MRLRASTICAVDPELPQVEPGPQHGRRERGQLGLDRGAEGVGEPLRGLHDHVDQVAAAVETELGALFVEVGDRLHDLGPGVLPDPGALVQDAVDGGLAQAGLLSDLANLVAVRHRRSVLCASRRKGPLKRRNLGPFASARAGMVRCF
jgi:hypothetical protein